jgi:Ca-activated chloride channel family protein
MDWNIENYWGIILLPLVILMGWLLSYFLKWKQKKKAIFAESMFQETLFPKSSGYTKILPIFYWIGFLFLMLAIADFTKGSSEIKTKQKMNNVFFLLDLSNSMNAEDVEPNRISMAKNIIRNTLPKLNNDRVGIVIFAGEANSIMPLTSDITSADQYLEAIDTGIIKKQGTDYLLAMQEVVKKFKNIPKGSRQVVLLSDGEDNEGNTEKAIKLAKEEGISVIVIGIGTEEGAPIPEYMMGQLMGYKTDANSGETIITKRLTNDLKSLSSQTNGEYIDGNQLQPAIKKLKAELQKISPSTTSLVSADNAERYYQYFLAISLLSFLIIYLFNPKNDLNL